jgi:hypothetical protein
MLIGFSKPCALNQAGMEGEELDITLLGMRLSYFTLLHQTLRFLYTSPPYLTEKDK